MFEMLLPIFIYLADSILSGIYSQGFLKEKYGKKAVLAVWGTACFFIQILVFEILESRFPVSEVIGIILNICVLLLSAIVASVILFQKLVQYNEETGKCVILENQMRQMQKEIVEIQDIYTDMKGLRHDMRNHIANISLLVKNVAGSVNEELESYIGKMEETVSKLDFAYQTGNPITDIIIHQKGQEAEKKHIQFKVDFAYPPNLLINIYDIAVILNNALENAIAAQILQKMQAVQKIVM